MAVEYFHEGIRFAGVIDVVSAVPPAAAIETPAIVNRTNAQTASVRATICFAVAYSLASVFGNLSSTGEIDRGKTTLALNWRLFNRESGREGQPHERGL